MAKTMNMDVVDRCLDASDDPLLGMAGRKARLGGWSVDLLANRIEWSDAVAAIHEMPPGYSPTIEMGISFYADEWRDRITSVFGECATKGVSYDECMGIVTAKGRRRWVRTIGEAVRDDEGRIVRVQGAFQDVTEFKRVEMCQLLCGRIAVVFGQAESFGKAMHEVLAGVKQATGGDAVGLRLRKGDDFPYLATEGFSSGFLVTENSLLERDDKGDVCRHPDGTPRLECTCGLVLGGKTDPANPLFTAGGSAWTNDSFPFLKVPVGDDPRLNPRNRCIHDGYASVALIPVRINGEISGILQINGRGKDLFSLRSVEALEGVAAQIGHALQRKQSEDRLTRKSALLDSIIDNIPVMLFLKDAAELRFVRFNRAGEKLLGVERGVLLGKSDYDLFPKEQAEAFVQKDREVLASGVIAEIPEEPLRTARGDTRILHTRKVAVLNAEGEPEYLLGISEDVTDIKEAETQKERARAQLHHSRLMENIGQLAAGIAHEINTPIQFVGDNLQFLKDAYRDFLGLARKVRALAESPPGGAAEMAERLQSAMKDADLDYLEGEVPKALDQSQDGVRRVAKIVMAMKEFSHPQGGEEKAAVDVNKALENTMTVARNEWKYVADLRTRFDPALPLVEGYPGEINQVFLNLIVNAAQAIAEKQGESGGRGAIDVETKADGEFAEIRVADTGAGIAEKNRSRIFKLFFTTKPVGKGTGQGLALAYQTVVAKHGGTLTFETEEGRGTTFIVRLPIAARAIRDGQRASGAGNGNES